MKKGHEINKKITLREFANIVKYYSDGKINCSPHAFFRLSEKQREITKADTLLNYLLTKKPINVYLQVNGRYKVQYSQSQNKCINLFIETRPHELEIVTFYITRLR